MQKLIFGCGYLGSRVAQRWLDAGDEVHAVTRSAAHARELTVRGIHPIVADLTEPGSLANLPEAETVLFAVGYDRSGGKTIHQVYVEGLHYALTALPERIGKFIYISSTGVYGQTSGEWIDEGAPCSPTREGGKACLTAEQLLHCHRLGQRAIVLRMAGIYGPQRIPRRKDLEGGVPLPAPQHGYLNLVHVEDAARAVLAAEARAVPPRLYLVSDDQPVLRGQYYRELARLLNAPEPRFVEPPGDSPAALRATSDKRIANSRLKNELALTLHYPTYREGLAAILADAG